MSQNLPIDTNTADTTTWRYVGHLLPDLNACDGDQLIDVLQRDEKGRLVRVETEYMGDGRFYAVAGNTVYWCYQRPLPTDYLTEQEASADLDVCGYAGKWKVAKQRAVAPPEVAVADYWLAVRLYFLELGGCYLSERTPRNTEALTHPLPAFVPEMRPLLEPTIVRQG